MIDSTNSETAKNKVETHDLGSTIAHAVEILRGGGLVAFPTETVYGLGCDARSEAAVSRLYAVKRRPANHPVIVHLATGAAIDDWAIRIPTWARALADSLWPGPLTLVLPKRVGVLDSLSGGHPSIGLRVPAQPVAQALLAAFAGGIAAPSANRFGRVSPTTADAVHQDLGADVDLVLDDGPCSVGIESTVIDCTGATPIILRPGGVTNETLQSVLATVGCVLNPEATSSTPASGTLAAHYAPRAQVVLVDRDQIAAHIEKAITTGTRVGVIALADDLALSGLFDLPPEVVLAAPIDSDEYARMLYQSLRTADAAQLEEIFAVLPIASGMGVAVRDRLTRAAAGSCRPSPKRAVGQ